MESARGADCPSGAGVRSLRDVPTVPVGQTYRVRAPRSLGSTESGHHGIHEFGGDGLFVDDGVEEAGAFLEGLEGADGFADLGVGGVGTAVAKAAAFHEVGGVLGVVALEVTDDVDAEADEVAVEEVVAGDVFHVVGDDVFGTFFGAAGAEFGAELYLAAVEVDDGVDAFGGDLEDFAGVGVEFTEAFAGELGDGFVVGARRCGLGRGPSRAGRCGCWRCRRHLPDSIPWAPFR